MRIVNRRQFLQSGSAAALIAVSGTHPIYGANDKIVVAAIGTSRNEIGGDGRGTQLARCFAGCPDTHVAYVCDVDKLRSGAIGRLYQARCWYFSSRPSIGRGKAAPVPDWLDWSLWQGPAPEPPYQDNVVHYNWHWFWHWGTAELGNNGVHTIDVCRWGLGVDFPRKVTCAGGRYRYEDDQETPDTTFCTMDFGDKTITWEARSCWGRTALDPSYDIAFYGDKGVLTISGSTYSIYDPAGKQTARGSGNGGDLTHVQSFLDAIRTGAKLNAEIEEGYKSVLLCHLGNISYRLGRSVRLDPATHPIAGDKEATGQWGRTYRPGWEPQV